MPGDYSRKTFDRHKHYSGVLMQQGRVQLDADWNEQLAIQLYRTEIEAKDVIGKCGVPKGTNGFNVGATSNGTDLTIAPGRIYVDGLLCELDDNAKYTSQPHYPNPEFTGLASPPSSPPSSPPDGDQIVLGSGTYLVYIVAWRQEITALDDARIREVALGGPDTAARLKTVWQVRILPQAQAGDSALTCDTDLNTVFPPPTGKLNARSVVSTSNDPCELPPSSGYRRLENQLYRVEIHKGGTPGQATFKWSRDNATVESTIELINGAVLTVSDVGKDDVLGFAGGQSVEIVDDESDLNRLTFYRQLFEIDSVEPSTRRITLKTSAASLAGGSHLKLRRWDQSGATATPDGVSIASGWIALEGGIEVRFSQGSYRAGDYWLIPARTATTEIEWPPFEVPNSNPIPQSPYGVKRHYCPLALLTVDAEGFQLEDCRAEFPSLTEICAEDICFDNSSCDLVDADNVQDALDRLCAARDLRHHNKHLHGWGIVCGLQVVCGPDAAGVLRRHVTVRPGYAIDCEGNDIEIKSNETIDLIDLIEDLSSPPASAGSPPSIPDSEVCLVLSLDGNGQHIITIEPYGPKFDFQSLFKGTLLMDFYNDCIKSLVDFFHEEFTPDPSESTLPVGPTQKRFTTFLNLFAQSFDAQDGRFVFLSGGKGPSPKNLEHSILLGFYNKLRAKLQSHTFCAMFDGARPFPAYPFPDPKITTIFGKSFHNRLRIAPDGSRAYTAGTTAKINVFDLKIEEMVAEIDFPGGSSAIVQDVAFSAKGDEIYAVAILNNKDSMFAVGNPTKTGVNWKKPTVICDVLLMTLGTSIASANVYAIGQGKGLYEIDPKNVSATPTPRNAFNAVGQLVIPERSSHAFATASGQTGTTSVYDRVLEIDLNQVTAPITYSLTIANLTGQDDLVVVDQGVNKGKIYVAVNPPAGTNTKHLAVFTTAVGTPSPFVRTIDLKENTVVRLGYNADTDFVMVTFEDSHRLAIIDHQDQLEPRFRHPVQLFPISLAVSSRTQMVYVLNSISNTITAAPTALITPAQQIDLQALAAYRAAVINAFTDLFGGLLQYLKDCFCDHLLIECPTCDEDDKIYLACVSIRNGQIEKVCNFSKRKYVKSFPALEYWLSIFPIGRIFDRVLELFCCAALPNFFSRRAASTTAPATGGKLAFSGAQVRSGVMFMQQTDFRSVIFETLGLNKIIPSTALVSDFIGAKVRQPAVAAPPQPVVAQGDILNKPVAEVQTKLQTAGLNVTVETYDPTRGGQNLFRFAGAPSRLPAGSNVTLVEENGKVRYYALAQPAGGTAPVDDLRVEVSRLQDELRSTKQAHDDALAARDQEIASLKTQVTGFQTHLTALTDLQKRIDVLERPKRPPLPQKKKDS